MYIRFKRVLRYLFVINISHTYQPYIIQVLLRRLSKGCSICYLFLILWVVVATKVIIVIGKIIQVIEWLQKALRVLIPLDFVWIFGWPLVFRYLSIMMSYIPSFGLISLLSFGINIDWVLKHFQWWVQFFDSILIWKVPLALTRLHRLLVDAKRIDHFIYIWYRSWLVVRSLSHSPPVSVRLLFGFPVFLQTLHLELEQSLEIWFEVAVFQHGYNGSLLKNAL